jgi:MMP endo-(1,4)-3-O-methyl-alpha-D-mannosidase
MEMGPKISSSAETLAVAAGEVAARIAESQRKTGEIPWCEGQKTDPWDHVEAAMGLCVGGYIREAQLAFEWMARMQREDGSWYASYRNGVPEDTTLDTNMSSYIAVGVWHYFLITKDRSFLEAMWETVSAALEFAVRMQAPGGEIYWAISPMGRIDRMALLTGSSSVYMSLKCGLAIAERLGHETPVWREAVRKLGDAIRTKPHLFNMAKSRYSMDWFYPILSGAVTGQQAQDRIDRYWKKFVVKGLGVRCVSDHPWITMAETSELSLALTAMGNRELAEIVFGWIRDRTFEDGSYWCGFTFPDMVIWPEDRLTWTSAVQPTVQPQRLERLGLFGTLMDLAGHADEATVRASCRGTGMLAPVA